MILVIWYFIIFKKYKLDNDINYFFLHLSRHKLNLVFKKLSHKKTWTHKNICSFLLSFEALNHLKECNLISPSMLFFIQFRKKKCIKFFLTFFDYMPFSCIYSTSTKVFFLISLTDIDAIIEKTRGRKES